LNTQEVPQYIRFRWSKAGGKEAPPFTPDALAGITQWSQGIPRLINSICDSALLMAYGDESPLVVLNYVRDAATNLALANASSLQSVALPRPFTALPNRIAPSSENPDLSQKFTNAEISVEQDSLSQLLNEKPQVPMFSQYADPKANSSLLKR